MGHEFSSVAGTHPCCGLSGPVDVEPLVEISLGFGDDAREVYVSKIFGILECTACEDDLDYIHHEVSHFLLSKEKLEVVLCLTEGFRLTCSQLMDLTTLVYLDSHKESLIFARYAHLSDRVMFQHEVLEHLTRSETVRNKLIRRLEKYLDERSSVNAVDWDRAAEKPNVPHVAHDPRRHMNWVGPVTDVHTPELEEMTWTGFLKTGPCVVVEPSYVQLAQKHHGVRVEVVDLGQYSAEHSNSCMFLSCAVGIVDRRIKGLAGALPAVLDAILAFEPQARSVEALVEAHRADRCSTLGSMADALRFISCETLESAKDEFQPYFHPLCELDTTSITGAYDEWVSRLRDDEVGDELVLLALAKLCGVAIQPVQSSGYRVPLMDPMNVAKEGVLYLGNDDRHWVWLCPLA